MDAQRFEDFGAAAFARNGPVAATAARKFLGASSKVIGSPFAVGLIGTDSPGDRHLANARTSPFPACLMHGGMLQLVPSGLAVLAYCIPLLLLVYQDCGFGNPFGQRSCCKNRILGAHFPSPFDS